LSDDLTYLYDPNARNTNQRVATTII